MELSILTSIGGILFIFIAISFVECQEDSLQSALNAIDRRQRDLSDYSSRYDDDDFGYAMEKPQDLAFLKAAANYNQDRVLDKNVLMERALLDYLDEESDRYDEDDINKRISSSFRERVEEDKQRQMEELARALENEGNEEYVNDNEEQNGELIRELWNKYRHHPSYRPRVYSSPRNMNKRYYYPQFGLGDTAGFSKRSRYFNPDGPADNLYMLNYIPRDEIFNRLQEDSNEDDVDPSYYKSRYFNRDRKINRPLQTFDAYGPMKRFPVTKRSSDYLEHEQDDSHNNKKDTTPKKQTDPKVAKELSNIFGTKNKENNSTKKPEPTTKPKKTDDISHSNLKQKTKPNKEDKTEKAAATTKEVAMTSNNEKPLQIKKKSINWSDYFGLDRRKKSDSDDFDKEWLMERYHKAVSLTSKRNAEIPAQPFKNHEPSKKESNLQSKPQQNDKLASEEKKIEEMDTKLKSMEDTIVDDALKYTGSHEGATDPKEVQDVKDKVISRLAAAYSLEKMRRALGEYKLTIARERERLKHEKPDSDDFGFSEEKRTSVPRKQAVDEDRDAMSDGDNNIKCTQGDEDCQEQNYRTPSEILETRYGNGECPKVQRACSEMGSSVIGHYGHKFEGICNMYQMCLLCSSNSWFYPIRQCNTVYLAKAYEICDGIPECKKEAVRSVRYLLDMNSSLQADTTGDDECELACPGIGGSTDAISKKR